MANCDPEVADDVPQGEAITDYDDARMLLYLRLLDAESAGADWRDVARVLLNRDVNAEPERARRCWEAHIGRARQIAEHRYRASIGHA